MQSRLKEIVAIKCIEKKRLNKHSMENLLTEISVMKDLSHRHIVKLIDFEVIIFVRGGSRRGSGGSDEPPFPG